jgi:hypothetical protein
MVIVLLVMGCSLQTAAAPIQVTSTPTPIAEPVAATLVPTVGRLASSVGTATVAPSPLPSQSVLSPTVNVDTCTASDERTQYDINATVDYNERRVNVSQTIIYSNQTDAPLDALVLSAEPNRWPDAFTLSSLTVDNIPVQVGLSGRRLDVPLDAPLDADCSVTLSLDFTLTIPAIIGGREAFRGYFGQSPRQINLGHWLPVVVPHRDGDWLLNDTVLIGEQVVLEPADWDVTFTVVNAPQGIQIAAPGRLETSGESTWRFQHVNGRDFAASISHVFNVSTLTTGASGTRVDVYTMPDAIIPDGNGGWINSGDYAAKVTAESLDHFASRFGDYIHDRLVIVQGDFPDGMEFSGFAFVSTDWFVAYDGTPAGYLMLITVHEVAHQWWYDQVGSDQALTPWLDEALSTYSEYVYIESYYPELRDWWWYFRINRLNPQGLVDSTVYEFDQRRPYINAVYLRGVLMLHEIRNTLGDDTFFGWLTRYAQTHDGQIADADDLWALFTPEQHDLTAVTRTNFLRNPGLR